MCLYNLANFFKSCVRYIFASLFGMSKDEHFRSKGKCFLIYFESAFTFKDNEILNFQIFK